MADVACVQEGGGGSDDLGLGLIRAVDRVMDGWCGADVGVDRAVDHGPRVHGRQAEGVTPRFNLDRPLAI
jgi:hypothetical protein